MGWPERLIKCLMVCRIRSKCHSGCCDGCDCECMKDSQLSREQSTADFTPAQTLSEKSKLK